MNKSTGDIDSLEASEVARGRTSLKILPQVTTAIIIERKGITLLIFLAYFWFRVCLVIWFNLCCILNTLFKEPIHIVIKQN